MAGNDQEIVIGISTDQSTLARQLRQLGQTVTRETEGYARSFERFGKRMDAAVKTSGVQDRINRMTGIAAKSTKEWTGALADQGKELTRLRAQYNPIFSVINQYKASVSEIQTANRLGAISADEMAAAIRRERQATLASISAIKQRNAAARTLAPGATSSFNTANIAAQFQDIGVTAAMGMNPMQIALQQGTQLSLVLEQLKHSGQSTGQALLGAFTSLISPISLVTIGAVAAGAAIIEYFANAKSDIKSVDDILKAHEENIKRLGAAYDEASKHEKAYAKGDSAITVNFLNAQELKKAEDLARSQLQDALNRVFRNLKLGGGFDADTQKIIAAKFQPFKEAISQLTGLDISTGRTSLSQIAEALQKVTSIDMSKFNSDVSKIGTLNPDLAGTAQELLNVFDGLTKTVNAFPQLSGQVSDADIKFSELQQAISQIDSSTAQKALQELFDKAKSGESGVTDVASALSTLEGTNLTLAGPIAALQALFEKAIAAKNALSGKQVLSPLGTVGPVYSGGGKFIDEQDVLNNRAANTKSQYQIEQEKLAKSARRTPIPRRTADDRFAEDIKSIQARTTALAQERGLLGATYAEQIKRNTAFDLEQKALREVREEARRKGDQDWQNAQLSEDQKKKIDEVSDAYARQADELRKAREAMQLESDILHGVFSDLRNAMEDGKITTQEWGNIFLSVLDKIIDKIEDELVTSLLQLGNSSGGGGGGLLGGLLGGLGSLLGGGGSYGSYGAGVTGDPWAGLRFATGGFTGPGGVNQPAGIVHKGEVVWSQADVARAGGVGMAEALRRGAVPVTRGGGGTTMVVSPQISVDARGAQQGVGAEITAALDKYSRHTLPQLIKQVNADPRKRG